MIIATQIMVPHKHDNTVMQQLTKMAEEGWKLIFSQDRGDHSIYHMQICSSGYGSSASLSTASLYI